MSAYTPPGEFKVSGTIAPNAVAQVTSYVYGALKGDTDQYMPTDAVRAVIEPGSTSYYSSQTDSITGSDYVKYDYDLIGEMTSMSDQNGTSHEHA